MTEQELVQHTLANLPRPVPPLSLHRNVMAKVTTEARLDAAGPQTQIWRRTQENGRIVEWRQGGMTLATEPTQSSVMDSSFICYTQRRNGAEITIVLSAETRQGDSDNERHDHRRYPE